METITLNGNEYTCKPGEFVIKPHAEYNNLKIYPKLGELERLVGLLNDLTEDRPNKSLGVYGWTHGGFLPIQCSKVYQNVSVYTNENIIIHPTFPKNLHFNATQSSPYAIFISENISHINLSSFTDSYILCRSTLYVNKQHITSYPLTNTPFVLHVPDSFLNDFKSRFWYYINKDGLFEYDNLIHLCVMVKNGGELFEKALQENLPIIDRWTILDTGSTDGTQDVVRRVLANKKGALYEEPFINFRDSRNRCLDLAGKNCKYLLMLDDTYALRNNLRDFLTVVRGDQFASSYSLLILSDDVEYCSNRITMSERGMRYIYTIHEVIDDTNNKENVVIPKGAAFIHDHRAPYMEKRTMDRKRYDLQLLYDMVRDDPTNPRHYYYLAQTYNLLEDYEEAAKWFKKRATTELKGHIQEAVDSWFEYGRILNFKLNRPWEECKAAYEEAYKMDPTRPDALYFIGIHYHMAGDKVNAYHYFKRAFELGYPIHAQFSLKPTLTYHFLPKFLTQICYEYNDWKLGLESAKRFLENNNNTSDYYEVMLSWYNIFTLLCKLPTGMYNLPAEPNKPNIVFVVDGNWNKWTGRDILTKGLGGSETYIVEIAKWIQASDQYNCVVFCRTDKEDNFGGVNYRSLDELPQFILTNKIHTAIVSRFSEYVPLVIQGFVDNVYLVLHDLGPTGVVIPQHPKLKKVLCLTKWHEEYFLERFPMFKGQTDAFYYGIDIDKFKPSKKVSNSFIYSSFPNRGLLPLLQIWGYIKQIMPDATLHIYSDINGKWVNEVAKEQMDEIRRILDTKPDGVTLHGWVSKSELAEAWSRADIWLYPCIFQETFCLTALEAAASKTLAIATPLAALNETVGDRGILINGNPTTLEWQNQVLSEILKLTQDTSHKNKLIESNYQWAQRNTWRSRGKEFIQRYLVSNTNENDVNNQGDNTINYANMYNWTHDLPPGSIGLFLEALSVANPKDILEIGTFAGTSLIEMLRLYPNATGCAVDSWKNYKEEGVNDIMENIEKNQISVVFENNIKNAGMSDRVTALKGVSVDKLVELIQLGKSFDFIYVDGSHKCLDCYGDMILAWKLLRKGGVLAVDDVLYHIDKVNNGNHLEYPYKATRHFLEKYTGQYKILSDAYRLFLQKL